MTVLEIFNQFFQSDLEVSHTSDELAVFMRLLNRANKLRKARFNLAVDKLMLELGMKTKRPFDTARKALQDAGLIEYRNGQGRGCTTEYVIVGLDFKKEKGSKNTPFSAPFSAPFSEPFSAQKTQGKRAENASLHKTKTKTTTKGANAPSEGAKKSGKKAGPPPASPAPEPEPWLAWVLANAPDVQTMREPLTAAQYAGLVAEFTEPLVREVLQAMHNTAGATGPKGKYKSANLTANNWCKRRCPDGRPPRAAPATAASSAPDEPELNHADIAQREAEREAELSAQRRQRRAQATT